MNFVYSLFTGKLTPQTFWWIVLGVSIGFCFVGIGFFPIYILDESKNAEAAREMLLNKDVLVPTFNDVLRTDKPPLHYFFMMISYSVFGVSAFSARFFSSVFGVMTLLATYHYVKKFSNKESAIIAWTVLLCSILFTNVYHQSVPDPYLIFFISFGLFNFFDYHKNRKLYALVLFYFSLALGTLAKGPVAIALPGLSVALFLLSIRPFSLKNIFSYRPIVGLLFILFVSAPWYIFNGLETHGEWTKGFFLDHNINRFSSGKEGHGGIFLITWGFVLLGLLPFSFVIPQGITESFKGSKQNHFIRFCLVVSLVFIVFFSISGTKLPNYTMPCYPFLAGVIAFYLLKIYKENKITTGLSVSFWVYLLICLLLPVASYIGIDLEKDLKYPLQISLGLLPLWIGGVFSFIYFRRKDLYKLYLSVVFTWLVTSLGFYTYSYPKVMKQNPVTSSKSVIPEDAYIVAYKGFDAAFPINYKKTFKVFNHSKELLSHMEGHPEVFVITQKRYAQDLDPTFFKEIFSQKALFELHTTKIYQLKSE